MKPLAILAALVGFAAVALPAQAQNSRIEVGVIRCDVAPSTGFIFGSTKELNCLFERPDGSTERYTGQIQRYGIDIGFTGRGVMVWGVFAPSVDLPFGALSGRYGGVSAEASVGLGVGADALLGGSDSTVALQPVSVSGQEGLNVALGIAELTLVGQN